MTDFSMLLNPEQLAAATAGEGPLLVLAAAGTGKTRTLVHRVAYLIEQGVPPDRTLLLTFTNRAAREMLERAEAVVGDAAHSVWSGTFHSVCARILRRYGSSLGYRPGFLILDEDDQRKLIGDIIKTTVADPKDFPKKEVVAKMISEAANERLEVEDVAERWMTRAAGFEPGEIAVVAAKYVARKRELDAMDFDDLLVNGLALLKTNDRIREMLQEHFLHVLVDEYQDTNGLQSDFTDILAAKHRNIMAYRSVPGVLDVANVVMRDAPGQFEKTLRPVRGGSGERPRLYHVYDGRDQADEILRLISEMRGRGFRYGDIAILYRSHFQSIDVQMTLARSRVPFRITSGVGVFEQVHVKDTLAYLRLVVNPLDELSFRRLVELLPGMGAKGSVKCWEKLGRRFDCDSRECRDALGGLLGAKAKPLWPPLSKCFECAKEHLAEDEVGEVVEDFVDLFYESHLGREWSDDEAEDRLEDLKELTGQIASNPGGLEAFLADVALLTNLDATRNDPNRDRVTLSTVHQAKGMEWPVVIVPWLAEGMFPSGKATEEGRMDEERRLFYVAVTREKDCLFLFAPQVRKMSDGGMFPVNPSVFVKEIPSDLLHTLRSSPRSFQPGGWRRW